MTRILVVDDAAFMRMRCSKLLGEKGYEVVEAANGAEALEKYKERKPDAVLLDITMPKMDGNNNATGDNKNRPPRPGSNGQCHGAADYGNECSKGRRKGFCSEAL